MTGGRRAAGRFAKRLSRLRAGRATPASFPYWNDDPGKLRGVTYFSYFEILKARWPNEDARVLLRGARPTAARTCSGNDLHPRRR